MAERGRKGTEIKDYYFSKTIGFSTSVTSKHYYFFLNLKGGIVIQYSKFKQLGIIIRVVQKQRENYSTDEYIELSYVDDVVDLIHEYKRTASFPSINEEYNIKIHKNNIPEPIEWENKYIRYSDEDDIINIGKTNNKELFRAMLYDLLDHLYRHDIPSTTINAIKRIVDQRLNSIEIDIY